jgi:hypothetical protein
MTGDGFDGEAAQYYSMGNANDWIPSEDGGSLVAVGKATAIRLSTNGGLFLKALVDAGFPADQLGSDISVLDGLQAHVMQVPAPVRKGLVQKKREDGKDFGPPTILVVSEIIALPGEKKKPAGAPKGKTAAAPKKAAPKKAPGKATPGQKAAAEDGGDVESKATAVILEVLGELGTITKKELPGKIFQMRKDDPDRNALVQKVFDDAFLAGGPWVYDPADGTLVMG